MRGTAAAGADSRRLGKVVWGVSQAIGSGFTANHFSAEMFDGRMDPLLMVDHFVMTAPTFDPHLHTGISAVTLMFEDSVGAFRNRDSLGHDVALRAGDLYWLAAASGAAHEEKPEEGARTHALQIFVNLPSHLQREPARSLHVPAKDVPIVVGQGHRARVVVGRSGDTLGASGTPEPMTILDVSLKQDGKFSHRLPADHQAWVYAVAGPLTLHVDAEKCTLQAGSATTVGAGAETELVLESNEPAHFVLMAAQPIREPRHSNSRAARVPEHRADSYALLRGAVMSQPNVPFKSSVRKFEMTSDERAREIALRERFASFWSSASGEPRAIYDAFVSASPSSADVTFEAVNEKDVRGWWVRPAHAKPGMAVLFIHGGGYVQGSATAYRGFVSQIASRTGVAALVIDYPLAPEATLPAGPQAALAAWQWLVAQGFEQIAIVGDSAGGGLALVTSIQLTLQPRGPAPVAAAVFSPWTDLAFTGASMRDPAVVDPLISYEYLRDCARKYCGAVPPVDPLASPLFGDLHGLPPLLIQVGTDERLLDDSRQFADRASQADVPVQLEIWEGMHHVFQLDVAHIESSRVALDRAGAFLREAFDRTV